MLKWLCMSACLLTCCTFLIASLRGSQTYGGYEKLSESKHLLTQTVASLEGDLVEMREELRKLKESKAYAKRMLRELYHVTNEKEEIIFFSDE